MEEYETEPVVPCLVCFNLRILTHPSRFRSPPDWFVSQQRLARELTGHDPFNRDQRLFVEAESLDATAETGCLSCVLLKEIWRRLRHTEQLCSGEGDMKGRQGFFLYYPEKSDLELDEPRALFLGLKDRVYVIHTMEGESCPWDAITPLPWSAFLPTLDQVRLFMQKRVGLRLARDPPKASKSGTSTGGSRTWPVLPTRLVMLNEGQPQSDVRTVSPPNIRLIETSAMAQTFQDDARYIALSHCWGSPDVAALMLQTTRKTISAFTQSIPWEGLTKTFQDAVLVARHMGVPYVWIDSLCIVQDDAQDWAGEASRMASIYENAQLTIAATGATDGHQGLFINTGNKPIPRRGVHKIKLPGLQSSVYVRYSVPDGKEIRPRPPGEVSPLEDLTAMPLSRRCWAFQERLLSPSILHFTRDELILEDDGLRMQFFRSCECEELDHRDPGGVADRGLLLDKREISSELWPWCSIVERYVWRLLTSEADRLPALSGVAYRFQQQYPPLGSYLAGLWEADILFGLHWTTHGAVRPSLQPILARKTLLSAPPTWSWASVGGSVIKWPRFRVSDGTADYLVEIMSATCFPLTSDRMGMVSGGRLTLRGRLCLAALDLSPTSSTTDAGKYSISLIDESMAEYAPASFFPDIELCSADGVLPAVYFLPLAVYHVYSETWHLQGLVLCRETEQVSTTNQVEHSITDTATFSRVGCAVIRIESKVPGWFGEECPGQVYMDEHRAAAAAWIAEWRRRVFNKFGQEQVLHIV